MSSNGTRKETRGWEISSTGQMVNISTDDVAIEELPPSGPIVVNAGGTRPAAPPTAHEAKDQARERKDSDALAMLNRPRVRKSTLDVFNDEMAVLERPLENDVEYIDEAPRTSRVRGIALFAGVVLGMGLGGGVMLSRRHAAAPPSAEGAQPATPPAAMAVAAPSAPVLAAQVAPSAVAEAPATGAADDDDAKEDPAPQAASSHVAWDKVKAKGGHDKPSRSASGKTSHHRSASKRTASAKHATSRHH
jgi:hypothetical protein